MTRFVCISDTHNQLNKIKLPQGDVLLHAGDWTMKGTIPEVAQFAFDLRSAVNGCTWGAVITAGNHDFLAEEEPAMTCDLLADSNSMYLQDSAVVIDGLKIWGSPWQPWFFDWAFNLERGEEIKSKWDLIPEDTDILITHGPPAGVLDNVPDGRNVGCQDLRDAVERVQPKLHVFGHIHHSYGRGTWTWDSGKKTTFVNASICTENYKPTNLPLVIDL